MTADSTSSKTVDLILAAFRASPDAITISRLQDGQLLEVNAGFERIAGYTRDEVVGKTTEELDLWSDHDRRRVVHLLRKEGRTTSVDMTLRPRSGAPRECQISCEVLKLDGVPCVVAVTRDVTKKKLVERRLQASEEKFAKAFRSSPDAITISRLSDGLFLDVNEGFQKLSGFSYEQAVGHRAPELGIWRGKDRDRIVELIKRDGRIGNEQVAYRMKSGEIRDFLLSAEIIELEGEPCMVAISRDVTRMRSIENEREELIEQLESQNAELERFTYTVSHELKSSLVTIRGFTGLADRHTEEGDVAAARRANLKVQSAAETMQQHLENLLELSRIGRVLNLPEPVSLSELAGDAAELLESLLKEKGAVLRIPEDLPVVVVDRLRIREVFQNLIENAVKFADRDGRPQIRINATSDGSEVSCCVEDDGIGIEPHHADKVFDLFQRLDPDVDGTGVGLALVKRIIEVHGGRIWIESDGSGHGTRVCFTLRHAEPPSGEA